jgi:hypothetical protein
MEAFYFLYSPSPLFTGVPGKEILGTRDGVLRRRLPEKWLPGIYIVP